MTNYNVGALLDEAVRSEREGDLPAAESGYRRVLEAVPDQLDVLLQLGNLLHAQGRLQEAIDHYRQALEYHPRVPQLYNNLANVFYAAGRADAAAEVYQMAIGVKADYPEAHNNLGVALRALGRLDEAASSFRRALELRPDYAEAHGNLGNALKALGDPVGAIACYRQALELQPDHALTYSNVANALQALGGLDEAQEFYEVALARAPELPEARWNRALLWLQRGDYERGWAEYEWGFAAGDRPRREFRQPRWDGAPLNGARILVHAEQGFGDTLQFLRYLPLVKARGGHVVFACPPELRRLLENVPAVDELVALTPTGEVDAPFDVQIPLLSLPGVFATRLDTIPSPGPYLRPDAELVQRWGARMGNTGALRVGLVWSGNPDQRNNRNRACRLEDFAPLAAVPGVAFYSLQKGEAAAQAERPPVGMELMSLGHELSDFADTAAVIANLDLVISVDTSVVHLAGALGRPVWTLLSFMPDWRWLLERDDSPWYASMRLFRQPQIGLWEPVFQTVAGELSRLLQERPHEPSAPTHETASTPASADAAAEGRASFNEIHDASHEARRSSARQILPPLLELCGARSVLDVGCGLGAWLEVAREHGVDDAIGIDGDWIRPELVRLAPGQFHSMDLEAPFDLGRRFDLVISLEVAEHLRPEDAEGFVDSLIAHGDVILFSAAVPGQGGNGHINEQLQHVWAEMFQSRGFAALDIVRPQIWFDPQTFWWLQQNTILYIRQARLNQWPHLRPFVTDNLKSLSVIHPELYRQWMQRCEEMHRVLEIHGVQPDCGDTDASV